MLADFFHYHYQKNKKHNSKNNKALLLLLFKIWRSKLIKVLIQMINMPFLKIKKSFNLFMMDANTFGNILNPLFKHNNNPSIILLIQALKVFW